MTLETAIVDFNANCDDAEPDDYMALAADAMSAVFEVDSVQILWPDEAAGRYRSLSIPNDVGLRNESSHAAGAWTFRAQPFVISDGQAEDDLSVDGIRNLLGPGESLIVPYWENGGTPELLFACHRRSGRSFSESDITSARALSAAAGARVSLAQLQRERKLLNEGVELLSSLSSIVIGGPTPDHIWEAILDGAVAGQVARAAIVIIGNDRGRPSKIHARNIPNYLMDAIQEDSPLFQLVIKFGLPLAIPDLRNDRRVLDGEQYEKAGITSFLGVPLETTEGRIGIIGFFTAEKHEFSRPEIDFCVAVARQAGNAAAIMSLVRSEQNKSIQLQMSYRSTLDAVCNALEARDVETFGHTVRVANLAAELGHTHGLSEKAIHNLTLGARMHDIGKIGVPDGVLLEKEVLTADDWRSLRRHPELGYAMVNHVEHFKDALPVILQHHERFDGGGYPFGLAGEKISIEARLFTVADAYDAMTSDRPYRRALPSETAVDEITALASHQFCPEAVEALQTIVENRNFKWPPEHQGGPAGGIFEWAS